MGRAARRAVLVPLLAGLLGLPATPASAAGGYVVYALDDPAYGSDTFDAAAGDTVTARYDPSLRSIDVGATRGTQPLRTFGVWPDAATVIGVGTYTVGNGVWMGTTNCSYVTAGTVTISELVKDPADVLTSLSLSYDATCDSRRVTGTIRYHSDEPWSGVRPVGAGAYIARAGQTVTRTVTLTGGGPTPVTLGTATVEGTNAAFTVTDDGCAGVTLPPGESCTVTLAFTPPNPTFYNAVLSISADTPRGSVLHRLDGRGTLPPDAPTDLRAVGADDGVSLSWAPPPTTWSVAQISAYRVYRDGASDPVATVQEAYYADAAEAGESHTYVVTAVTGDVEGAASASRGATVPTAPTSGNGPVTGVTWYLPGHDDATATPGLSARPGTITFDAGTHDVEIRPVSGEAWRPGTVVADLAVVNYCRTLAAPLTVTEARVHADGTPETLALTGRIPCGTTAIDVDVRYAATTPLHAPDTTPDAVSVATTPPGLTAPPVSVTIANHGSEPLLLGAPVVPAHWQVDAGSCVAAVAPGASCALGVTFAPTAPGDHSGVLTVPDNTPRGHRTVGLRAESRAVPGPVRNLRATPLLGAVLLTFDAPETAYPAVEVYGAERATAPTGPWQGVVSGKRGRLADQYEPIGQRVYYRVRAKNASGYGPYSYVSTVTTGRELVYSADTGDGVYHLTGRGLPGDGAARITTTVRDEEDPAFSANRREIAYTREDVTGRWHLYRTKAVVGSQIDGAISANKVAGDVGGVPWTYRNPRWSPNGTRLAYACRPVSRTYWDLCIRSLASGAVQKVPAVLANGGHWLPNGKELVVVSATSPPTIQIVAHDNSYRIAIPFTSEARDVALSPDGSRIAWTRFEGTDGDPANGGGSRRSLRISPLSGGGGIVVRSTGYSNDPEWALDGETVYFTHGERTIGVPLRRDVWSAKATGSGLVNLTNTPDVDEDNVAVRDAVTAPVSPQAARPLADFTGDGKADIAVFRPGTGAWLLRGRPTVYWGRLGDIPVAGDYNGDRKAERAVFRPSDGTWRIQGRATVTYGRRGDVPVPADYNGDGRTDIAVFRPSDGSWSIYGRGRVVFGRRGDVPVPADYNGDRKAEIAIYRPGSGLWSIRGRGNVTWDEGAPAPGDFLGRGRAQISVLAGPYWRVYDAYGTIASVPRTFNDVPAFGDFNGDRRFEPGVYNPTLGLWRILGQANVLYGRPGDIAV